ncbi:hypothetical protein SELMODRAFT_236265 [Selaginella moellendorffii]|uniref:Fanconi-associated nuclease n=1 Tax=Selaginella moellendorffii TaxID=88036 RepID=D8T6X5_SELML|nr:hypothetical protein SELMODRAFT_236265 [Selaginella moellendorffii]
MLRGRESLIRLVGKRQRNVSLPARDDKYAGMNFSSTAILVWILLCFDSSTLIDGFSCSDTCLQSGKKKKNSVQHTLFHFNLSKKIDVLPAELNSETRDLYNGCLEARIAGRKYHRDVECQAGMRVHLVREPENPMDTYAVKVLTADGLSLGHIPKELSRYLSPLMDKAVVDVQGYVSESTSEAARLKLDLREIQSRTIGSLSEEKVLAVKWSCLMDAADKGQDHGCRYQQNFLYMLQVVLERDLHLFTPDEIELLEAFRSISSDGQRLFVRLAQRKGPWFRLQNIFYEDIGDTNSAVHELVGTQFLSSRYLVFDADVNSSELLEHLTVQELKDLAVNSKIMVVTSKTFFLVFISVPAYRSKREILGGSNLTALIREATGPCIRIAETVDVLLWRLQRLFFLNGEQEFHVFLLVDIGRIKYPSYRCARTMPVFASREDFLAYEQALQLAQVVDMSLEAGNSEALNSSFRKARTTLELINAHTESKHPFLARFSAAWVYATICTVAASFLEKERRYAEAVNLFKQLLSMQYCPGRRGYWTLRLSIDLEHLQRLEESLLVAENGLNDFNVRGGDRIALQRRVLRLGKPPRRWKVPPYAALLKKKHKVVTIMGRPLNNANGMKSRFYGYDGQQCSVEDLALQYYAGEDGGGWKGVHSESGIWLTLFGLLMWDVIFSDVPDVFQTPFQTAPLDLCTDSFYPVRSSLIESRLQAIRDGGARQLVAETWEEHYGTSCSGVNWKKYSLEDLQTITVCIGGPGLSAICNLLAEDHSNWTAGMPDLLLWKEKEAKLAEVKGPGDRLSEQQVAWFLILSDANVPVELCKVSKTMNDRS